MSVTASGDTITLVGDEPESVTTAFVPEGLLAALSCVDAAVLLADACLPDVDAVGLVFLILLVVVGLIKR